MRKVNFWVVLLDRTGIAEGATCYKVSERKTITGRLPVVMRLKRSE